MESCLEEAGRGGGAGPLTLSKRIHLEARHFLGQDGLGQVEEGRVVDREVMVILLQDPHCHALDAVGERAGRGGRRGRQGYRERHTSGQVGRAGGDMTETSCFQEAWLKPEVYLPGSQPLPELGHSLLPAMLKLGGERALGLSSQPRVPSASSCIFPRRF